MPKGARWPWELYAYGPFVRKEPVLKRLDLIVVREDPGPEYWQEAKQKLIADGCPEKTALHTAVAHFDHAIREALAGRREPITMVVSSSLEGATAIDLGAPLGEFFRLWSDENRDWRAQLEVMEKRKSPQQPPLPAELRLERFLAQKETILRAERFLAEKEAVTRIFQSLARRELELSRATIEGIQVQLTPRNQQLLDQWLRSGLPGEKLAQLAPLGVYWLQKAGEDFAGVLGNELWAASMARVVHLGRPSLGRMLYLFRTNAVLKEQCLIPFFEEDGTSELLVFQRGPGWKDVTTSSGRRTK